MLKYGAGKIIFNQGDEAFTLCFLVQGRAKLAACSPAGREAVIRIVQAGEILGADSLCPQQIRATTATALSDCRVMHIPEQEVVRAIQMDPDFAAGLTSWLANRAISLVEDIIEHIVSSSEQRLARLLLLLAGVEDGARSSALIEKITQETLGQMVGTTRQRINEFMKGFCNLGYISYENGGMIRVNRSLHRILTDNP